MTLPTLEHLLESVRAMPIFEMVEPSLEVFPSRNSFGKLSSSELMDKVRRGDNWHTNMLQLVAHWVGRKLSDDEILAMAPRLTLTGYTIDQTIKEMSTMIISAREKWQQKNPNHAIVRPVSLVAIDLGDFLALDIPPRELILAPIIPSQGLAMLYAPAGIGKTFVSLSVALAVATGSETLAGRWTATKRRRVLFVDGEMSAIALQERLKAMTKKLPPVDADYMRIITPDQQELGIPDLATEEGQALIEEHLEGVELLILDNLSSLLRNGRENEAESWLPLQTWLLSLRRRGISVLVVHHAGKSGGQRGTSKKEDLLDTVILLKRPEDYNATAGSHFLVYYQKARGFHGDDAKPFDARLETNSDGYVWSIKGVDQLADRVRQLREKDKTLTQREIAELSGTSAATVNRILSKQTASSVPVQEDIVF